mmetsp:Transcript_36102/g.75990  ORF Transcript_36102/g.75990 Transcript_36102/m.75990 type:complete len:249 (+) Transcript_36102:1-747(+)
MDMLATTEHSDELSNTTSSEEMDLSTLSAGGRTKLQPINCDLNSLREHVRQAEERWIADRRRRSKAEHLHQMRHWNESHHARQVLDPRLSRLPPQPCEPCEVRQHIQMMMEENAQKENAKKQSAAEKRRRMLGLADFNMAQAAMIEKQEQIAHMNLHKRQQAAIKPPERFRPAKAFLRVDDELRQSLAASRAKLQDAKKRTWEAKTESARIHRVAQPAKLFVETNLNSSVRLSQSLLSAGPLHSGRSS